MPKRLAPEGGQTENGTQTRAAGRIVTFFLAMLALTLFARGMSGAALTQVGVCYPNDSTVTEVLTFAGVLESQTVEVLEVPEGLRIGKILVTEGQNVKAGESLLELEANSVAQALTVAQGELDKLKLQMETYQTPEEADDGAVRSAQTSYDRSVEDQKESQSDLNDTVNQAQKELERAEKALSTQKENLSRLQEQAKALKSSISGGQESLDQLLNVEKSLANQDPLDDLPLPEGIAAEQISQRITELEAQISSDAQSLAGLTASIEAAEQEVSGAEQMVTAAENTLSDAKDAASDNKRQNERAIADAKEALEQAWEEYDQAQQQAAWTNGQNQAEAQILSVSLEEMERKVELLKALADSGCLLTAPCDGVILTLSAETGGSTDGVQIRIAAQSDGYRLTMTGSELAKLSTGGAITVRQGEQEGRSEIAAVTNEDGIYTATAWLSGTEWENGWAEAELVLSSDYYQLTLPASAYHEDNTGGFLYVLDVRESVLGLQYVVRREPVTLLAYGEGVVAVEGILSEETPVILSSSRSVQEGDSVRFG
ncbi:MAG: hypothetical protein IJX71_04180, partial [Oscillospiraceae bacterium]|nr:hypothetical protein [Oscillospiraceae bacterium]